MKIQRYFSEAGKPVEQQVDWKKVDVAIKDGKTQQIIFQMDGVEVPDHWSDNAAQILANKYFRKAGVPQYPNNLQSKEESGLPGWLSRSYVLPGAKIGSESSAKQVFHRLAGCWTYWGWKEGLLTTEEDARAFYDETYMMLVKQVGAPNSPQWFNTGLHWAYGIKGPASGQWTIDYEYDIADGGQTAPCVVETFNSYERPQPHACFIQPVSDDLVNPGGIMDLWTREVRLFKYGSGTGTNFSPVRSRGESLSGGGISSGLMSFLRIGDTVAGSIKSGGVTRRAAKMVILNADHPEICEFIDWKMIEEAKAAAMYVGSQVIRDAYLGNGSFDDPMVDFPQPVIDRCMQEWYEPEIFGSQWEGPAISTVSGQNSNNTVRVTNEFMKKVEDNHEWFLTSRTTGQRVKALDAKKLWNKICRAAWASADPGLQFHDTINEWHTCPNDGEINASNPCCFVGETLIDTSEGKIRIDQLEKTYRSGGVLPYAFSFSMDDRMPVLRKIRKAWIAGEVTDLVEVETDKGIKVSCTPEHRFLTRKGKRPAGEWIEAKDLTPGMRLRKIGRLVMPESKGSRCTLSTRKGDFYQSRFIWEQVNGPIPNGYDVHHMDKNSTSDKLSNFELVESSDHRRQHSAGRNNPRYINVDVFQLVEVYEEVEKLPAKRSDSKPGANPNNWNRYIRDNDLAGKVPSAGVDGRIRGMSWDEFTKFIDENRGLVNHRVVSVRRYTLPEPVFVYDIEVDGVHNFGVTSSESYGADSIIVHNSEYMFLDNTACNLASLNLVSFLRPNGSLDLDGYAHAVRLYTMVLEISVHMASFPSMEIALGSYNYRTLGLGYANLGGLMMRMGIAYDSDKGRALAAGLTAVMHFAAYKTSNEMAAEVGAFPRWEANKHQMTKVLDKHRKALQDVSFLGDAGNCMVAAVRLADSINVDVGFRNAQVTLIAPTGTISFVMDCDTTGIEPDFGLVKNKSLAGGGHMKIVNQGVEAALRHLGYNADQITAVIRNIEYCGSISGFAWKDPAHEAVFDCANDIDPMGHVKMVAAVQPFLSGAVSKTINMPHESTVEDVSDVYIQSWKFGLKAVALYRDGSKLTQPYASQKKKGPTVSAEERRQSDEFFKDIPRNVHIAALPNGHDAPNGNGRKMLPWRREKGFTQKVKIDGQSLYLHVGEYEDGRPGEIFLELAKQGSTLRGMGNLFAIAVSIGLQHGVPVREYIKNFLHTKFEPAGIVEGHKHIKMVSSIADYVARELAITYLKQYDLASDKTGLGEGSESLVVTQTPSGMGQIGASVSGLVTGTIVARTGGICPECNNATLVQNGTCTSCSNCLYNTGCG